LFGKSWNKKQTGDTAEILARDYLCAQGLALLDNNVRFKGGEIDLIMQDQSSLIFVEVRYRRHNRFGSGAETVTITKQRHIIQAANLYLQKHPELAKIPARFDVVSISSDTSPAQTQIDWIQNAFQVEE